MMRKLTIVLLFLFSGIVSHAQIIDYHENMETIDSVFSAGNPGWFANQRLSTSGVQCDSSYVATGDTTWLETMSINLTGKTYVSLQFKHICKVSFFDSAFVEVFNGSNWIQLTAADMLPGQPDSAIFAGLGNKFSEASFIDWQPGQITSPDNTWWKSEAFDLSALLANVANAKVRWKLYDAGFPGSDNRAGWFIDDVQLLAAPCELTPPTLVQNAPVFQNVVLYTGPFTLNATITDASGLDTANLAVFYTINNGPVTAAPLTYVSGNNFAAIIPQVSDSDTVCYYFSAADGSACHNTTLNPVTGCRQFIARSGLAVPFCDGFDFNSFWTDSTISGSPWQLGVPTTSPPSANSAPNVWEVALNAQYANSTISYLYSPVMNFTGINNATINFWFYKDCELSWDGARIDFSLDGGLNWFVLGGVGTGINWYNDAQLNSSQQPAWTGVASTWTYAEHSLSAFDNQPQAQLRFTFTSDVSVPGDGFAIDDLCINVPTLVDLAADSISQPVAGLPAGNCEPVVLHVTNVGQQPLTNFTVSYSINGGTVITTPFVGPLSPGIAVGLPLPCAVIPAGNYTICAWVTAPDSNQVNDTVCVQLTGVPVIGITDSTGYCDNFEGSNAGWYSAILPGGTSTTQWQYGTPAYGTTTGAHSGINAWDVNLSTRYFSDANTALYTPYFSLSANANPQISFWHKMNTELVWDAVILEYKTDTSLSWTPVGVMGDTASTNWYGYNGSGQPVGWSGLSGGWVFSQYRNLSFANGHTIQFRFLFGSDGSIEQDGFSIDDFCMGPDTTFYTGIADILLKDMDVKLWPNPAQDYVQLAYTLQQKVDVSIQLLDVTGRVVLTRQPQTLNKGMHETRIDTHGISNGMYVCRISAGQVVTNLPLIISR